MEAIIYALLFGLVCLAWSAVSLARGQHWDSEDDDTIDAAQRPITYWTQVIGLAGLGLLCIGTALVAWRRG